MTGDRIKEEAEARSARHEEHPTHRPLSDQYNLVGLRGEEALALAFGGEVDLTPRPGGDGGRDMVLSLWCKRKFKVDVKAARKPGNLIVEQGKAVPETIYILAAYYDDLDLAFLLGWEWGAKLLKAPVKDFGYGVLNHFIPRADLRSIEELKARTVSPMED